MQATNIEVSSSGIKFPDVKTSGVSLRSQKMKLPGSVGQKKAKAIEQLLTELGIGSVFCAYILLSIFITPSLFKSRCISTQGTRISFFPRARFELSTSGTTFSAQTANRPSHPLLIPVLLYNFLILLLMSLT